MDQRQHRRQGCRSPIAEAIILSSVKLLDLMNMFWQALGHHAAHVIDTATDMCCMHVVSASQQANL